MYDITWVEFYIVIENRIKMDKVINSYTPVSSEDFVAFTKKCIVNLFNGRPDVTEGYKLNENDVHIVWYCKTLKNH